MLRSNTPSTPPEDLFRAALQLPEEKRADLVGRLIASLQPARSPGAAKAWEAEIARRVALLDSGKAEFVSWEQIQRKLVSTRRGKK